MTMKKLIRTTAWAALLAGTTALTAFSPQAGAQSLEEELSGLLADHPQIKAARENVAAAEEGRNRAFADYLPKVQATGNFGYERVDSPGRRTATDPDTSPFTTGQATSASVTVTQTLFNGFRSDANNAVAASVTTAAGEAAETSIQGILFEAVSAYLAVMRNMRLLSLSGENEETIRLQLELEDERVRRGAGIAVDVLEAKSRLQAAKERRVAFKGAFDDSISSYNQVYGHMPDTGELIMPTPPLGLLPETIEDMIAIALEENPAVRSATAQIDIANEQRRIAQADFFPTIDASGEWSFDDDIGGTRGTRRDYKAK
ncbi:MAG: TolC family protein, partial [Rhodospirillales bacterium]